MSQRTKLVILFLESVGIDCADIYAVVLGELGHIFHVVNFVPGNVQRNSWGEVGVFVNLRRVADLFKNVSRGTRGAEDPKASS